MTPDRLAEFARTHGNLLRELPDGAVTTSVATGLLLFGTLGHEAWLRVDGTVVLGEDGDWGSQGASSSYREASAQEAAGAIKVASRRIPDIGSLLPPRREGSTCPTCKGTGHLTRTDGAVFEGIWCESCLGLCYLVEGTT